MPRIHPTALVDSNAVLADDVTIGPYSIIGPNVKLSAGTVVEAHCVIEGHTQIGENNLFHSFCSVGCVPQDKKYNGEPTQLTIGDRNTFFQNVTISVGTSQDRGHTIVGNDNWIMAYAHIAHDCMVGNNVILANNATLAGHVSIGDFVILGGLTAVHQFCVIGAHAMAGGGSIIVQDLPPFVMCEGNRASARSINIEGLKRRGFSPEAILAVKKAYKILYRDGIAYSDAIIQIREMAKNEPALDCFVDFFDQAKRGIVR
ncbi:acyl-ACP--UDP-N-acetylglucosamine O-acyltransferase [uncultured Deefgea sp.]|uniref:acyl-ACP--UDP-N-acetylglucosamine O-acyltransferase n=1 Tax=uncultured Deefgea sp. TaxID=1304914 RepID=UPI0026024D94|nr:acyl-ACP--UDP-N-acetylglucosamine O-acyltransferase [uncultured Deefgea sp.]